MFPVALLALAIIALGAFGTYLLSPVSALDKFWTPMLENPNPVLLCVGSPSSTNLAAAQSSISPGTAARGTSFGAFTGQRSTTLAMLDVNAANDLASYLITKKKDSKIYPANALTMWELRSNSVVVFGVFENYWATKLGANLRFRFNRESKLGKRWIEDAKNPGDRSWTLDMSAPVDQVESDYAVISRFWINRQDNGGPVLQD